MDDKYFMNEAIKEARKGIKEKQSPFGAVIVHNKKIIARGHNNNYKNCDPTAHAEIIAIRKACKKQKNLFLKNCTIYSTAEPCPLCLSAIHWCRINRVVYGASINDAKKAGFNEINFSDKLFNKIAKLRLKIKSGILKQECKKLFKEFKCKPY